MSLQSSLFLSHTHIYLCAYVSECVSERSTREVYDLPDPSKPSVQEVCVCVCVCRVRGPLYGFPVLFSWPTTVRR